MTTQHDTARHRIVLPSFKAVLLGAGLTILWIALGLWQPTTTYHLAPLLIGATPPAFAAGAVDRRTAALLAGIGLTLALAGFGLLALFSGLDGPTIGPFASASQESLVLAFTGAIGGGLYAAASRGV